MTEKTIIDAVCRRNSSLPATVDDKAIYNRIAANYGEIPPYEVAIIYTLSDQPLLEEFEAEAVHVLGPRTGVLYEWRKKE